MVVCLHEYDSCSAYVGYIYPILEDAKNSTDRLGFMRFKFHTQNSEETYLADGMMYRDVDNSKFVGKCRNRFQAWLKTTVTTSLYKPASRLSGWAINWCFSDSSVFYKCRSDFVMRWVEELPPL